MQFISSVSPLCQLHQVVPKQGMIESDSYFFLPENDIIFFLRGSYSGLCIKVIHVAQINDR